VRVYPAATEVVATLLLDNSGHSIFGDAVIRDHVDRLLPGIRHD
jgi:hypothetical protein